MENGIFKAMFITSGLALVHRQWADLICKDNRRSRLRESPISMGKIDVLITRRHRVDVFLDEVNSLGLGRWNSKNSTATCSMAQSQGIAWRLLLQIACYCLGNSSIWSGSQVFCGNGSFACGLANDPLFGQRQGAMPRYGNGGFSDTVKVELGRQLGQAVL